MADADCPCKVRKRDDENPDANRWKEQKVVFPPTQDKRNRTHTAIGNGAGRAQFDGVLSMPRRAGGLT